MLLSIIVIGLVGYILLFGYYLEVMRRVHAGMATPLPDWNDLGSYITRGFMASIGTLVWLVPFVAVATCGFAAGASMNDDAGSSLILATSCFLVPLSIALGVLILPVVIARYAVTGDFGAMFQFGAIFSEVQRGFVPLLITFVMSLVVYFVAYIGLIACFIGIAFTLHYAYLVHAYLIGDMYRQAAGGETTAQTAF
jgi:hypothetical protein